MAAAAVMIAVYHLWISPFPRGSSWFAAEQFIRFVFFIGVDMFFFVSAYSIGSRETGKYTDFVRGRFVKVYGGFAFFALLAFILGRFDIAMLLKTLTGYAFFTRGGGSFLWFVPAIMLVYLLMPLYKRFDAAFPGAAPVFTVTVWISLGCLLTEFTSYDDIFIFFNRIPAVLAGFYAGKYNLPGAFEKRRPLYYITALLLTAAGAAMLYFWGYPSLNSPMYDFFYVLGLPLTIGAAMLLDAIPAGRITALIGSSTLEMYGLQMVLGYIFAEWLLRTTKMIMLTNAVTLIALIAASCGLSALRHLLASGSIIDKNGKDPH